MIQNLNHKAITVSSNILMFLYLIYTGLITYLFTPECSRPVPMDDFFRIAPVAAIIVAIALGVTGVLTGAFIIRSFWNRLVASLFPIRHLNYQEALAIILMLFILFGLFGL
jgi:hypothetical protein